MTTSRKVSLFSIDTSLITVGADYELLYDGHPGVDIIVPDDQNTYYPFVLKKDHYHTYVFMSISFTKTPCTKKLREILDKIKHLSVQSSLVPVIRYPKVNAENNTVHLSGYLHRQSGTPILRTIRTPLLLLDSK